MDLKLLVNTIRADKCVLLLGPEIITTETGQQFNDALITSLNVAENENIVKYYEGEDFFLFNQSDDNDGKLYVYYDILNFYQNTKASEIILRKIAQIPINLIISLNPDKFIYEVLKKNGINAEYSYYNKNKPMPDIKVPTKTNPLVYNLLGDIEESETLVLTHQDLFDFLEGALNKSKLPDNLREIIANAHSFIFLGFKFEKWYVQLIIRILNLHIKKDKMQYAFNKNISENIKSFYFEEFTINFIDQEITNFVDTLYKKCKNFNILKVPIANESSNNEFENLAVSKKVEILIAADNFEKTLELLKSFFEAKDPDLMEDIILLESRFSRVQRKILKGIIDNKEADIEKANIADSLLKMNKDVKNLENN